MVESNFLYLCVYKYILMCERRRDSMLVKEIEMKKWGNSQGIRFGKEELSVLGESNTENLKFEMVITEGKIVLTPKNKKPETLDELFASYEGEPLGKEDKYEWGNLQGREII